MPPASPPDGSNADLGALEILAAVAAAAAEARATLVASIPAEGWGAPSAADDSDHEIAFTAEVWDTHNT